MTPEFHPLAQAELNDAAGFYEAAAVGLGGDFLNEMQRLITRWSIRGSANGLSCSPLRISVASRDTGRGELAEGRPNETLQLTGEAEVRIFRRLRNIGVPLLLFTSTVHPQQKPPIIDVHVHSFGRQLQPDGRPAPLPCSNDRKPCDNRAAAFATDEALIAGVVGAMKRHNIVLGVLLGGPLEDDYLRAGQGRFIRAAKDGSFGGPPVDSVRALLRSGTAKALGELPPPYLGLSPADSLFAPYIALAEEFDVPVLIHVAGIGGRSPAYRSSMGRPLLLEGVLKKHPALRLYVENAGYPFGDEIVALLYMYPNVYVDVSTITWLIPRTAFHDYLRRLVRAGFEDRVMFGTDQFGYPEITAAAVEAIESAAFLTAAQQRKIFYDNAARFFRLSPAQIAKHHGK